MILRAGFDEALLIYITISFLKPKELVNLSLTSKKLRNIILRKGGTCDQLVLKISPLLQDQVNKLHALYFYEQIQIAKKQFMVSCGDEHTVVVEKNRVFTFGDGSHGQLGNGTLQSSDEARELVLPGEFKIFTAVGGGTHTLILTKCGKLFGCGDNTKGALGPFLPNDYILSPQDVGLSDMKITMISCTKNYSALVLEDGEVLILGNSIDEYFGTSPYKNTNIRALKKGEINEAKVTDVSAGYRHLLLLTEENIAYGVGDNSFGQVGNGSGKEIERLPVRIALPEIFGDISQVAAGSNHSLLLTNMGSLFSWGNGSKGQLGHLSFSHQAFPKQIKLPFRSFPVIITCGTEHSVILDLDSNVLTFGANEFGQTAARSNFFVINRPSVVSSGSFAKKKCYRKLFHVAAGKPHTAVLGSDLYMFGQTSKCGGGGFIRQHSTKTTPVQVTLKGCVTTDTKQTRHYTERYKRLLR